MSVVVGLTFLTLSATLAFSASVSDEGVTAEVLTHFESASCEIHKSYPQLILKYSMSLTYKTYYKKQLYFSRPFQTTSLKKSFDTKKF